MRYKQLVTQKLVGLENRLNAMDSEISRGNRPNYIEHSKRMKDQIEEIQTLINTEDQS